MHGFIVYFWRMNSLLHLIRNKQEINQDSRFEGFLLISQLDFKKDSYTAVPPQKPEFHDSKISFKLTISL